MVVEILELWTAEGLRPPLTETFKDRKKYLSCHLSAFLNYIQRPGDKLDQEL